MSRGLSPTTDGGSRGRSSHALAQAVLLHVCTRPGLDVPDAWIRGLVASDAVTWLVEAAERTMIAGLLWAGLTTSQRDMLPAQCSRRLRERHLGNALRWQTHRRLLVESARKLAAEGIAVVPLKGAALLHQVYPDPGQRAIADLDLLVPEDALEAAHEVLGRDAARVSHQRISMRHVGEIVMEGEGGRIELHGALTHAALWPQTGDLLETGKATTLDGVNVIMPGEVDLWLHLACHGLEHSPYSWPRAAADLARVHGLPQWSPQHWQAVWQAAERHDSRHKVLLAAAIAGGGKVPPGLLATGVPPECALAVEAQACEAWGMGTTAAPVPMGPWARSWVTGDARRGALLRAYVFRPGAHLIGSLDLPLWAAIIAYPGYVLYRSWRLARTLLSWRAARRGRFFPRMVNQP